MKMISYKWIEIAVDLFTQFYIYIFYLDILNKKKL